MILMAIVALVLSGGVLRPFASLMLTPRWSHRRRQTAVCLALRRRPACGCFVMASLKRLLARGRSAE
jgi:hypothetical protein